MLRRSIRSAAHALLATLIVTGCSVTVQPIRPRGGGAEILAAQTKIETPVVSLDPVLPDGPPPSCPDEPPAPVIDKTARFVLQNGHPKTIRKIVTSADGRILASAGDDGIVRVWDVRNGLLLRKVGTAGLSVLGMSLSADGKRLAYYAPDNDPDGLTIRMVDLDKDEPPRSIGPYYGAFMLFADGRRLVSISDKVTIIDTTNGTQLQEVAVDLKKMTPLDVVFDRNESRVAIAIPGEVVVVDVAKGAVAHRLSINNSSINDTPFEIELLDNHVVVRAAIGQVSMYSLTNTAPPRAVPGAYKSIAVADDRLWLADLRTSAVSAFSLPNLKPVELPKTDAPLADLIATSRDRSTVVFAHSDFRSGTRIDARDTESMHPLRTIEGRESSIESLTISPTTNELITGSITGELAHWSLRTGERELPLPSEEQHRSGVRTIAYAPDGETFASTENSYVLRVRDAKSGRTIRMWSAHQTDFVRFARFIPKTNDLLTVSMRRTSRVSATKKGPNGAPINEEMHESFVDRWSMNGPKPPFPKSPNGEFGRPSGKTIASLPHEAMQVAMSTDGARLALLGQTEIALLNVDTGKVAWVTPLPRTTPGAMKNPDGVFDHQARETTFSPDGKALIVSTRRLQKNKFGGQTWMPVLLVINSSNGAIKATYPLDTNGPVAWHKNTVFVGGTRPVLLDAPGMNVRARIAAPDNNITSVAVHPTRDLFIMGGDGGATSFVDERGGITATLVSTPNGEWIAATPDGAYRSSIDGARSVAWSFASPLEGFSFERFAARFDKPELLARRLTGDVPSSSVSLARPPRLQLDTFRSGVVRTADRSLTINTTASSASRVDRVRAFVDGRPVADKLVCAKEGSASLTIPLHAGQNRVGLVAYDAAGQASNTQNLDVVSTSPLAERPNLYVVTIGVSQYPNMTPDQQLEYADDDARSVAESFEHQVGPGKPFGKIFSTMLLDDKVTVSSVEKAIASLRAMRPDDLGVVFFAGHGAKLAEGKMVFMTNQAAFTRASAEKYGIGWDKIHAGLSSVRGRVLMMLDACHSGYLTTEIVAPNEELARQLAANDRAGVFIFSAARGSQFSFEVPPGGISSASRGLELAWGSQKPPPMSRELPGGHGLFTSALLEALEGEAPDRDRSGATEVGELVDYVTERVRAASNGKQTPWVARREMFGEFFVVPAKK